MHVVHKRTLTLTVSLSALLILASAVAATAVAARAQARIFEDDRLLLLGGAASRDVTLDRLVGLGVSVVRVQVSWREFEPDGPRLREGPLRALDGLVEAARVRGLRPLLTLSSPAPDWAAGAVGPFHSLRPDTHAFGRFVGTIGQRYNGRQHARVDLWALWNEPNHPEFLAPQRTRGGRLLAPALLRGLLRYGGRALRDSGHGSDTILVGEWLPVGSDGACALCAQRPLTFARELLCLDAHDHPLRGSGLRGHPGCGGRFAPLPGSGWSVHAYARSHVSPLAPPPTRDDLAPAYLGGLHRLLVDAARYGRVRPRLRLWETEDGVQSNPPDPRFGVSLDVQAADINEHEFLAWRLGYVATVAQYALRDDVPLSGFQSGLLFADGRPKPALAAYRLPLVALRSTPAARAVLLWMRVPAGQRLLTILPPRGPPIAIAIPPGTVYLTRRLGSVRQPSGHWQIRLPDGTRSRTAAEIVG